MTNEAKCPKCGSLSIQSMVKKSKSAGCTCCLPLVSGVTEATKYINLCQNCGHKWDPKSSMCFVASNSIWHCHKIPERCFSMKGQPMQICARCLGVFIGLFVSIGLLLTNIIPSLIISVLFISVILLDWGLQNYFGILSNNMRRISTGVLGGIGVASLLFYCVNFI